MSVRCLQAWVDTGIKSRKGGRRGHGSSDHDCSKTDSILAHVLPAFIRVNLFARAPMPTFLGRMYYTISTKVSARSQAEMIDQAGFAGQEYVYTSWGRFRNAHPMRECMREALEGGNTTGYADAVSELNWSPEDRVRLNIPPDPEPELDGVSGVHFRKVVSAQEFLDNTPVNIQTVPPDPNLPSMNWHMFEEGEDRGFDI